MLQIIDLRATPPSDRTVTGGNGGSWQGVQQPVDPRAFAFLTLVNDESQYATCSRHLDALEVPPGYTVERVKVYGATSMADGYQRAMEASAARYKLYIHQDLYLVNRRILSELLHLFHTYPRLGMVGVVGATRFPPKAVWWINNAFHSYGRLREYFRPGGFPASLYVRRRVLHFSRFRSVVGDYVPAAVVDGLFMATQYDLPWANSLGGFELYDHVQALEFIKAGFEVGIARQEAIWCIHWGPSQERSREQIRLRDDDVFRRAAVLRAQNPTYIDVPVRTLLRQHRYAFQSPGSAGEHLGIVLVTSKVQEALVRCLRALVPQCDSLNGVDYEVVVVGDGITGGTVEAVRREFPHVVVITNPPARECNVGLRHLGFPTYILVMHDGAELFSGSLDRMVQYLREHPSHAGVVPSLVDQSGNMQRLRPAIVNLVRRRPQRAQPVTFVGTTCALVRGEVFFDVGLYDDRFSSDYADLEWSLRAKRRGYSFGVLPEARVIHHHARDSSQDQPESVANHLVDALLLVHKHGGRKWAVALYWVQRVRVWWLALRWRHDSEARGRLDDAIARMKALYHRFLNENRLPRPLLHETPES